MTKKIKKLPVFFKPLLWDVSFSSVDEEKDKRWIITRTINYGKWTHWQWILKKYKKEKVKEIIKNTPTTEFRQGGLKLASILLGIKDFKYAFRNINSTRSKNFPET